MAYKDIINNICNTIHTGLIDFNEPRSEASMPTLASSEFITNKQQGDWAEDVLFRAINDNSENIVAVRYGKSDDLVAGDAGFEKFFNEYQAELDTIGKRPDILLFKKEVFDASLGYDISSKPSNEIGDYVAKAIAGIEVRSSDQCWSIGDVKELPTMFTKETSKKKVSYTCFEGGKIAVNINKLTA
ncbi:MAG: AccI family restriction endonuclease [Prevotella sp.]|nr:AccI family restriction endonuclease [Prevotella sp.]